MDSKSKKEDIDKSALQDIKLNSIRINESKKQNDEHEIDKIEQLCDENLTTLQKIHAILVNCANLSKKQKLEFCESERYFMKLYLKKLQYNKKA